MKNIVFVILVLFSQLTFSKVEMPELFCDASQVQNKDWTKDIKGYQQKDYKKIFPVWLSKAESGSAKHQFYIAKAYYFGDGVDKDINKAAYWYKKSSEQNYPVAKNNLALMYEAGEVVEKNTDKAFKLICNAAIQNVSVAQNNIVSRYYKGKNDNQLFLWAKTAANNGSDYGKLILATIYLQGLGVNQNIKKAKNIYLDLYNTSKTKEARSDAALNIAQYYEFVAQKSDINKALEWYLVSAKLGNTRAKYNIGSVFKDAKDYKKSFKWFKAASDEGNADAMQALSIMYRNGWGVEKNLKKSFDLTEKAESLGSVTAIYNLAMAYDRGLGVQQNKTKAFNLFLKSANKGEEFSSIIVGRKYFEGDGVKVNLEQSAFWLYKAYKNKSEFPYRHLLVAIYFANKSKGLLDIDNLSKDFIFGELLPALSGEELYLAAYELDEMGNIKEAIPLFEMASKKGHEGSIYYLGSLFSVKNHPEYRNKYYDLEKAIYWLEKSSKSNIGSNKTLARIYFGLVDSSYLDTNKAFKFSTQAVKLFSSGSAKDYWQYKGKTNIMNEIYSLASYNLTERGLHEASESVTRKIVKKSVKNPSNNEELVRRMHLANISENRENLESIYLDVINNTNKVEDEDVFNVSLAIEELSTIYYDKGNYKKAIDIIINNLGKASNKEVDFAPYLIFRVAFIYLNRNYYKKAKEYFSKYKDLLEGSKNEFHMLMKKIMKGRVDLFESIMEISTDGSVDDSFIKMQKGMGQIFNEDKSRSGVGVIFAENAMRNFISIGKYDYAYGIAKPAINAYKNNFNDRLLQGIQISSQEKDSIKNVLSNFIYVAEKTGNTSSDLEFETMQLAAGLDASNALIKTIYKKKIGLDASLLIDKLEVLRLKKRTLIKDKLLKITSNNKKLNSKLDVIDSEISSIRKELERKGLNSNSINLFVSSAQNVIDMLHKKDALLTMLVSKERTFVWLVTSNGVYRHHANMGSDVIKGDVKDLLSSLNPSQGKGIQFPMESSSKLYNLLIRPFDKQLKEIDRLIIVPDSTLSGIPFSILSNAKGADTGEKIDYIDAFSTRGVNKVHANISASNINKNNWLINRFAITVAPSIYSYIESEKFSKIELDSKDSFIGIGNPVLNGTMGKASKKQLVSHINTRGSISKFVSEMAPLPETEKELSMIAKSFSKSDLFFGENATEIKLKEIDLSQYGVISFATHALVSNEIESVVEPSLILTPVDESNPNNDGLLTASEISNLKLNADIVLLSACNTASSFGESNSQGLSGLASSFFNAGARSLLVSYWSVISESAVDITTRIFKPSNEGRSYAHKHRNAVLDLLNNSEDRHKLQPSYWAPFSVIGVN